MDNDNVVLSRSDSLVPCDTCSLHATPAVTKPAPDYELIRTVILSLGQVAALLLFVYMSFMLPSAATILVPLIIGPGGALAVVSIFQRRRAKLLAAKDEQNNLPK
jgi:hypothetical protein